MSATEGRCHCGAVQFSFTGTPAKSLHCHCESCRRATSSPMTTFVILKRDSVSFKGDSPGVYASSPGVERWFCKVCGSQLAYITEKYPGKIDLYVASFDNPGSVRPEFHVHCNEQLPWLELADDLPRYPRRSDQ